MGNFRSGMTFLENVDKPVREVTDEQELAEKIERDQVVGVADNAIIFRREVIVTDDEIKDRLSDMMGNALENFGLGAGR